VSKAKDGKEGGEKGKGKDDEEQDDLWVDSKSVR
jgi:hypothetical protein